MSMYAVLLISLAAAVVLVVGGGLMMYMSNLVRNAYELKVQINSDMEQQIKVVSEDIEKRSKWIKRDLIEELEKFKAAQIQSNARTMQDMVDPLSRRIDALEQTIKTERTDWSSAVNETRTGNTGLETKITQLRKDLRRIEEKLGMDPSSASGSLPPKPGIPNDATATAAKPPIPSGPREVGSVLPDLS